MKIIYDGHIIEAQQGPKGALFRKTAAGLEPLHKYLATTASDLRVVIAKCQIALMYRQDIEAFVDEAVKNKWNVDTDKKLITRKFAHVEIDLSNGTCDSLDISTRWTYPNRAAFLAEFIKGDRHADHTFPVGGEPEYGIEQFELTLYKNKRRWDFISAILVYAQQQLEKLT